jgi:RHS repeat-associated protein
MLAKNLADRNGATTPGTLAQISRVIASLGKSVFALIAVGLVGSKILNLTAAPAFAEEGSAAPARPDKKNRDARRAAYCRLPDPKSALRYLLKVSKPSNKVYAKISEKEPGEGISMKNRRFCVFSLVFVVVSRTVLFCDLAMGAGDSYIWHFAWDGSYWEHPWNALSQPVRGMRLSTLAVVARTPDRFDVVVAGSDNHLYHTFSERGLGGIWDDVAPPSPEYQINHLSAVSSGPSRLDVMVAGADTSIWHTYFDGSRWQPWDSVGSVGRSIINLSAVSTGDHSLDVVAVTGENFKRYHSTLTNPSSPWEGEQLTLPSVGATIEHLCAVSEARPGQWDAFIALSDGSVWHTSHMQSFELLGKVSAGRTVTALSAASWAFGRLDVFAATDGDYQVWHNSWNGSSWELSWDPRGPPASGVRTNNLSAVAWGPNRLDVFAAGQDNHIRHNSWSGTNWQSTWDDRGQAALRLSITGLAAVSMGLNLLDVFMTETDLTVPAPIIATVPNLVGLPASSAKSDLLGLHLIQGTVTKQTSTTITAGLVISQNPASGTSLVQGSSVSLVVSSGPQIVSVPNVVGLTQAAATTTITGAQFALGTVTQSSSTLVPTGNVISQNPPSGTSVAQGSLVNLVISSGPQMVTVPSVVGLTQMAATTALSSANLTVGAITKQISGTVLAGNIIGQTPVAGTTVVQGSMVNLLVSQWTALPPDPSIVASPIDSTVATAFASATAFIWSDANSIQTGVAPNIIIPTRAAVLRGKVLDKTAAPLPGVTITVFNHPEFGQTLSRADGMFDMAVNGGGQLTLNYAKPNFFTIHRQMQVPWRDYAVAPDVVLLQPDSQVTTITLASNNVPQFARGSAITDGDGRRQATLLFLPGTQAQMVMQDGSVMPLTQLHVHATEYTVGANGNLAMPAELPATSAYTYAVEFSADEAVSAGAARVDFIGKPVIFYLENFLHFHLGQNVPTGYYDRQRGVWIPSDSGRVIQVLSISAGRATVDVNGSGVAADALALAGLGITDDELQNLASLYRAGQSLWRVPISHFSADDCNWLLAMPPDAGAPGQPPPVDEPKPNTCEGEGGSIIDIGNQNLGESIGIVGTPFYLHYTTDRAQGRTAACTLRIPLSGATVPTSLKRIDLEIDIAGRKFSQSFPSAANQSYTFTWDRKDAYGRILQGGQIATIKIGFVYAGYYQYGGKFGLPGISQNQIIMNAQRNEDTIWQVERASIGSLEAMPQGLGGWTLSVHHSYDPNGMVAYFGDGKRRSQSLGAVITTVAGNGMQGASVDGASAVLTKLNFPQAIAVGPDGSLYIADSSFEVHRVDPSGIITRVAGNGMYGFAGDGSLATDAELGGPLEIAVDSNGNLYLSEWYNKRIRKVDAISNIITTVAGSGQSSGPLEDIGDGGPATQAKLGYPEGVAVGRDGSLYIADTYNNRVRRVDPGGIISTVAGNGTGSFSGDAGPAVQAEVNFPQGLAVGPDGSLYIVDTGNACIRRVGPDGIITTVAGGRTIPWSATSLGDGGPATQAPLGIGSAGAPGFISGIAVASDGTLYISDQGHERVRRVDASGIITTVAGGVVTLGPLTRIAGFTGDGGPATQAQLNLPQGLALGPNGSLYIADFNNNVVRRLASSLPGFSLSYFSLPAEDGSEVYQFNSSGRHQQTQNALTGAIRYSFGYDSGGHLSAITDADNNKTTIAHDANGVPTSIVGPFRQQTLLNVDANGYLSSVRDPAGDTFKMTYFPGGLLETLQDPNGNTSTMAYDSLGRLQTDTDAAGGLTELARTDAGQSYTVNISSGLDSKGTYQIKELSTGDEQRVTNIPGALNPITVLRSSNGSTAMTYTDGSVIKSQQSPDPRFFMQAPITANLSATTAGVTSTLAIQRTAVPVDPTALTLDSLTDNTTINGRSWTSSFDKASMTITRSNAAAPGRRNTVTIDSEARTIQAQVNGLFPINLTYYNDGKINTIVQGTGSDQRMVTYNYDSSGYLHSVTYPLERTFTFQPDATGRITRTNLPDQRRQIALKYDLNGNVISVTPPGKPEHIIKYNSLNLISGYVPPPLPGTGETIFEYNSDRQIKRITLPGPRIVAFDYGDCCVHTVTIERGQYVFANDPSTGRLKSISAPGDGGALVNDYNGAWLATTTWNGGAVSGSVTRTPNSDFRVESLSVNGVAPISFIYNDPDGLLTEAGSMIINRDSEKAGLITGINFGTDGESEIFSYNGFGELTGITANFNQQPFFSVQYTPDNLGRIVEKSETIAGTTTTFNYTYDAGGRLWIVQRNGTTTATYTYDDNDNRKTLTHDSAVITAGDCDAQDRLPQYGDITYTYSANGELQTAKMGNNPPTTYQYDEIGNLLNVTLPDGTRIDYVIDGRNRRIGKKVNGQLTQGFLYQDKIKPIAELDNRNAVVSRFVYATRVNVPDYLIRNGTTYRILTDRLGSPRLVVKTTDGTIAQRIDYDEFGNVLSDTNPGFQPFGFAGGLYDRDTGLVRLSRRDYDPMIGRWTAKDPMYFKGGSSNLYAYVADNPVSFIDSFGLQEGNPFSGSANAPVEMCVVGCISVGALMGEEAGASLGEAIPELGPARGGVAGEVAGGVLGAGVGVIVCTKDFARALASTIGQPTLGYGNPYLGTLDSNSPFPGGGPLDYIAEKNADANTPEILPTIYIDGTSTSTSASEPASRHFDLGW